MRDSHDTRTPAASTLADVPTHVAYRIESIGLAVRDLGYYVGVGLRSGGFARVLARYPEHAPRFIEVETAHTLVSVPIPLAAGIVVTPC